MTFEGVVTPILTPFTEEGAVSEDRFKDFIEFLRKNGIRNLFVCGTFGSGPMMTVEERKRVIELSIEFSGRNTKIIVNVSSTSPEVSRELAKYARQIGADAVASTPPFYYSYDVEAVHRFYAMLLSSVDLPVFIYNIPSRVGFNLPPGMLSKLADEGIAGIKESSGDLVRFYRYMSAVEKRDFVFLIGTEALLVPAVLAGADGCVSGLSNIFPELVTELYSLAKSGNHKEAFKKQFLAIELREILFTGDPIPTSYALLRLRGIDVGYPKPPFKMPSKMELEELKRRLAAKNVLNSHSGRS